MNICVLSLSLSFIGALKKQQAYKVEIQRERNIITNGYKNYCDLSKTITHIEQWLIYWQSENKSIKYRPIDLLILKYMTK